jgi:protein tyrosine/serine phosphatase
MKKIILLLILLTSSMTFAQIDRSIGMGQYKNSLNKETKVDYVEESLKVLIDKIKLDDMQAAMAKVYLKESFKKMDDIFASTDIDKLEKNAKIEELQTKLNNNISEILSPEQKEKYEKLIEKKK